MANGDTDQNPGEEDRQRYDLYSEEDEQEIFDRMEELALAGELDDDSYRALLADYNLTPDDFTPPENVGGLYDDGYDLGQTEPPPADPGSFDDSDPLFNAGRRALSSLPGILGQMAGRASELSSNAGGYEDVDGDGGSGSIYTPTTTTVSEDPMVTGGGTPVELNPDGTPVTTPSGSIYDVSGTTQTNPTPGGGGGSVEFEVSPGVYIAIPEGTIGLATELLQRGVPIANLLNEINKEKNLNVSEVNNTIVPDPNTAVTTVDNTVVTPADDTTLTNTDMTPEQEEELAELRAKNAELQAQVDNFENPQGDVTTGEVKTDADASAKVGDIDLDAGDIYSDVKSEGGQGGSGGNVSVNIEGEAGFDPNAFEAIKPYLDIYSSSSDPLEEGVMPKILPEATGSLGLVKKFAEGVDAINRDIGFNQAKTATDIYGQTISDVEDSQSSLFKSNVQQAGQLGDQIDSLMGLDFLQQRDADQLGFGQAEALGRSLGSLGSMLAGRQRAESKRENLRTASDLLGRKQSVAADLASIQGSIYSQVAPNIGVDPGAVINIAGTDINNILRERGTRQLADATRESGKKDLLGNITGSLISKFL